MEMYAAVVTISRENNMLIHHWWVIIESQGTLKIKHMCFQWIDPNRGPGTQSLVLYCSRYNSMDNLLQAHTHVYVLYIVAMHSKGIIHSRPLFSDFDPQSSLLSVLQSQALHPQKQESLCLRRPVKTLMHMTFDPQDVTLSWSCLELSKVPA